MLRVCLACLVCVCLRVCVRATRRWSTREDTRGTRKNELVLLDISIVYMGEDDRGSGKETRKRVERARGIEEGMVRERKSERE